MSLATVVLTTLGKFPIPAPIGVPYISRNQCNAMLNDMSIRESWLRSIRENVKFDGKPTIKVVDMNIDLYDIYMLCAFMKRRCLFTDTKLGIGMGKVELCRWKFDGPLDISNMIIATKKYADRLYELASKNIYPSAQTLEIDPALFKSIENIIASWQNEVVSMR
jgi:hypothetical protein